MLRVLGWLPLTMALATPTFAARIDVADATALLAGSTRIIDLGWNYSDFHAGGRSL